MRKSLGQNFLNDNNILQKIIKSVPTHLPILEIGTGGGALTQGLAKCTSQPIYSYEIDFEWYTKTKKNLENYPNLNFFNEDFLKATIPLDTPFMVIANIPYYITSPIIDKCLSNPLVSGIYVMVQKEIATRITASPGSKDYSSFSIFCQTRAKVKTLFTVAKTCFSPVPKVDSAFVELVPHDNFLKDIKNLDLYNSIIRSSFWGKRKTITNCLTKSPYLSLEKTTIENALNQVGISLQQRGEKIKIEDYITLSNILSLK